MVNCERPRKPQIIPHSLPVPKPQKIDLQQEYPCPCCRGKINPLVLTEALGCDHCHKIFVLSDDSYALEQVSSPYAHSWQWDGQTWRSPKSLPAANFSLYTTIFFSLGFMAVGLWYFWTGNPVPLPPPQPVTGENQER